MSADEGRSSDAGDPFAEEFEEILAARFDAGSTPEPVDCGEDPSPLSALHLTVRTISGEGRFRPRNVGAIWIEDEAGNWVKTLERWGERRARYLMLFNEASGGDVTDAVTGATLSMHRVHELTWDLTDRSGCEVPNGGYAVRLEVADGNFVGVNAAIPFQKGEAGFEVVPDDVSAFRDMNLRLE